MRKMKGIVGIFAALGIGTFIAFIICLFVFVGEQAGLTPIWSLITLPELSVGENTILFVIVLVMACFAATFIIVRLMKW
jgi:hypothetical protein